MKEFLPITATFIGEIQADYEIPDQNWNEAMWDADFAAMKRCGIDTAVIIRCGVKEQLLYPSEWLMKEAGCRRPRYDKMKMFFKLAEKHDIKLWIGSYFSGNDWMAELYDVNREIEHMKRSFVEIWEKYAQNSPVFGGWYLSQETTSPVARNVYRCYKEVGKFCHDLSGHQTLVSPSPSGPHVCSLRHIPRDVARKVVPSPEERKELFGNILADLRGSVDIVAFQNAPHDHYALPEYMAADRQIIVDNGMIPWTNLETFELEVALRTFPPISFERLLNKMEWAKEAKFEKAITYEFSHFMSPNAVNRAANWLHENYMDYLAGKPPYPEAE